MELHTELREEIKSIYLIPPFMREICPDAYTPHGVSIGPYHYMTSQHFISADLLKRVALRRFSTRTSTVYSDLCNIFRPKLNALRGHYTYLDRKWENDNEFIQLMIYDGVFIYELLNGVYCEWNDQVSNSKHDYLFNFQSWRHLGPYFRADLLMLENQIPFDVITDFIDIEHKGTISAFDMVAKFFGFPGSNVSKNESLHLLHFYHMCYRASFPRSLSDRCISRKCPTAFELRCANIKVIFGGDVLYLDDCQNIHVPLSCFDRMRKFELFNVCAFEQLHSVEVCDISSFLCLLEELITSSEDVEIAKERGLISSLAGEDLARDIKVLAINCDFDQYSGVSKFRDGLYELYTSKMTNCRKFRIWRGKIRENELILWFTIITTVLSVVIVLLTILQYFMKS